MPTPSASEAGRGSTDPASLTDARFADDLARLIDLSRDRVLVAVSGGPDSVALLLLTHKALGARCAAATVDHGLRPDSAAEARAVAELCGRRGIAHAILTGPMPERAGRTANVSARARALRYALLEDHRAATGADWVATAHHADDQRETLLMRLNRGAGVGGLAGVRARSGRVIRPVLGWPRSALAEVVDAADVTTVEDPSNRDDRFDRARLRKALAGAGAIGEWLDPAGFGASAAALADAEEALAWAARAESAGRIAGDAGLVWLDPAELPAELLRRLVLACLARIEPDGSPPNGPTLGRAIESLRAGKPAPIGAVLVRPGPRWSFAPAPPRRPR